MTRDTPNPEVDVSFPDDMTLREFQHAIYGLSQATMAALSHGAVEDAEAVSTLQHEILKENPETAKLVFEHDAVSLADHADGMGVEEFIESIGLDPDEVDYDAEAVNHGNPTRLDQEDAVDIDVE